MGKGKARQAAALRAHAAVPAADEPPQAPTSDRTVKEEPVSRFLQGKIEFLRSATRSALGLSKIYLAPSEMTRYGVAAGSYIALMDRVEGDMPNKLLVCGVAWPLDKIKRHGIGVSSMWEDQLVGLGVESAVVQSLQSEHSRIRRREAVSMTLRFISRATTTGGVWPSEKEKPLLARYVHVMLNGVLVHKQARLSLSVHGVNTVFEVEAVVSNEQVESDAHESTHFVYRISMQTAVNVHWKPSDASDLVEEEPMSPPPQAKTPSLQGFSSIGGLGSEIATIRQIIEQPLVNPELFQKFGLPPPKGMLMFGPPGTGKTMIARALATELNAKIFFINGPEVVSKYIGESESNLRQIFQDAGRAGPSMIFIDEIDAICPKRDGRVGEMEKRMVATLLTLMDGLEKQSQVVVLAATNRPNALDPAIRRPGRFDREVEIAIPNADARHEILKVSLARLPHKVAADALRDLSGSAHGYVGADISALCKEAALLALQRTFRDPSMPFAIELGDLHKAMRGIRPSALREISIDVPRVLWNDIGGQHMIKQQLKEAVEWPLQHPEAFVRMGIRPPKGVLLYGPPGCSKTLTAKALATESSMNFIAIKGPELFSKWVGESEKAVQSIFRKARAAAPTVVFFDEIDAIASQRGGEGSSQVADRVLSQLLTELDGIEPLKQVLVVAATNRPDLIDSALMRPGRIDRVLYVGPPDLTARHEILSIHCRKMPLGPDVEMNELAKKSDGFSGAELYSLCREAAMHAIEEDRAAPYVTQRHFLQALERITPQIDANMIRFFEQFRDGRRS
ncbi:hypothetical protein Poli38472_000348 [Pythium oligandrum]|uniref:AAA+ ATPase domain-containing protein n=1 Tax=Pythium oligandrum TaxID=41045 RepID=A0A8K1CBK0_PYTOL|nr:hypothetical protein Poli38472_000348 [Pythium oligandrum]|eukprot:TMW60306.1 hypothetical protein Poli38472_000348 [Pythium oligandrum]